MSWSTGLSVTGGGTGVVSHAGSVLLRMIADRTGLTGELSKALYRRSFTPVHDRGRVLADVAVMVADGGEAIGDIDTLRHQSSVFGQVASPATVWRALDEITPAQRKKIAVARARTRRHVWNLIAASEAGFPTSKAADTHLGEVVVLDVDATIVVTHSEKEHATGTFKRTFGYHPLAVWCDNTTEFLAAQHRPGNAGSNTASDHVEVLTDAIAQIPARYRRKLLVRADGAGASHALVEWLTDQNKVRGRHMEYTVGYAVNQPVKDAIAQIPHSVWDPAIDSDGDPRETAQVAELTHLMDLAGWPAGMRVICRRERPSPGAQLSLLEEADGWRYQVFATNTTMGQLGFLEARHRAHARVEDRIRVAKASGLGRFPSREYAINTAWLLATAISADLVAWARHLTFHGHAAALAKCEPKTLRYRFWHTPARLVHTARKRLLRFPDTWPWTPAILAAFTHANTLSPPH